MHNVSKLQHLRKNLAVFALRLLNSVSLFFCIVHWRVKSSKILINSQIAFNWYCTWQLQFAWSLILAKWILAATKNIICLWLNRAWYQVKRRKAFIFLQLSIGMDDVLTAYVIYVFDRVNIIKNVRIGNCILVEIWDKTFSFKWRIVKPWINLLFLWVMRTSLDC